MKFPRVAFFEIEGKGYKSRTVFWNQKEEDEWLDKYGDEVQDILIVEATEADIQDSLVEGDEFIECEDNEEDS